MCSRCKMETSCKTYSMSGKIKELKTKSLHSQCRLAIALVHHVNNQSMYLLQNNFRGVGRTFSRGVVLNAAFQKGYFCTDLIPNTLYRKCIKFAQKKDPDPPDPPPPSLRSWIWMRHFIFESFPLFHWHQYANMNPRFLCRMYNFFGDDNSIQLRW